MGRPSEAAGAVRPLSNEERDTTKKPDHITEKPPGDLLGASRELLGASGGSWRLTALLQVGYPAGTRRPKSTLAPKILEKYLKNSWKMLENPGFWHQNGHLELENEAQHHEKAIRDHERVD